MTLANRLSWLAALLALLWLPAAHAQLNIGVVDIGRLLDESPQAKSAMKALQEEFAPRQRAIVSDEQAVRNDEQRVERDGAVMSDSERQELERTVRQRRRDLMRRQNEYLEDLNLRRNEELGRLQRALLQEVQNFAQRENYDLIVGDGVLYASNSVDVTAQVLAGLERAYQANN